MSNYFTASDIIKYLPTIEKYTNYQDGDTYFDNYIDKAIKSIKLILKKRNIEITDNDLELNENLRELILSKIVYEIYLENSYRVEEDRYLIDKLEIIYKDLLKDYIEINSSGVVYLDVSSNFQG